MTAPAGIVHLGLGAFARAHLAAYTDAANRAAPPGGRWGILGASLRNAPTAEALRRQQGRYTLALRDADAQGRPRLRTQSIGCLIDALPPAERGEPLREAIAAPACRIVSLTITEKGYFDTAPGNALDVLLGGLERRRARQGGGLTLLALDNLAANGRTLRSLLLARAAAGAPGAADWIERHCTFPCSMVDRIVPRTTDADRAEIAAATGWPDAAPVVAEPFTDWVLEDRFAAGRPDWGGVGVRLVTDAGPYERLKLRLVNGSHSALAYLGQLADIETVDAAVARPELRALVQALMRDDMMPTLSGLGDLDAAAYQARLLERFANPALRHRTAQIAMDGSQKLPLRLLAPLAERIAAGGAIERPALAVAAWLQYLGGRSESGRALPLDDPMADALHAHAAAGPRSAAGTLGTTAASAPAAEANWRDRAAWMLGFTPVFGALGQNPVLIAAVARQWRALHEQGALAASAGAAATSVR